MRQLVMHSGFSRAKLHRIKNYWLNQTPNEIQDLSSYKHVILDGTYFHKDGCLVTMMSANPPMILSNLYVPKEGFTALYRWFLSLKARGLDLLAITSDGERSTLRAIDKAWPYAKIQRCLYHIQHEGCRWLRSYPNTQPGKELRQLLLTLTRIKSVKEQNEFIHAYKAWLARHWPFVLSLPMNIKANVDLKRTITLLNNALPNMFHYLMDPCIHATTNALEGWHSRIKRAYRQHAGMRQIHKIQFLRWFSWFKNQQKTNNL
ncbi:MAG: transposase [Candidatus Aureabacteria bacterium]|nr:transposase [Candidatus Auribacterota bacterium]